MPRNIVETAREARVLTYHVVSGGITPAQVTHDSEQKTVEGGVLELAVNGGMTVNDATVIHADVEPERRHPRHRRRPDPGRVVGRRPKGT